MERNGYVVLLIVRHGLAPLSPFPHSLGIIGDGNSTMVVSHVGAKASLFCPPKERAGAKPYL